MASYIKNRSKIFVTLGICLLIRLLPLRAPNVEPIMAAIMPSAKAYGAWAGFAFGALSIFLYDIATGTLGARTLFTASAYGIIGFVAAKYFAGKNATRRDYVKFAILGTLFYDAITGLTVGPLFFGQSFIGALIGQIPFTALHLLGNAVFAYVLSPGIYHFLIRKKKRAAAATINIFNPKTIN